MQSGHADAPIVLSAHANRVPVLDGHTVALSVGFENPPSLEQALDTLRSFKGHPNAQNLPSAPAAPLNTTHGREPSTAPA